MKKLLVGFLAITFFMGLTACDGDDTGLKGGETDTVGDVVTVLEDAGYVLTEHDSDARTYFSDNTVADLGLTLTVKDLYIGYLDSSNWVQVIGLDNSTDAANLKSAFETDDSTVLVYQSGNCIVVTYTQAVIDLFE